jgi:hypothetical protein
VCLAGQYRTGKSFFLNQLASRGAKATANKANGFRVGPTTESCTRGIWLWDPVPTVRNARGERVLFMDTEGIAATDNDESYDAKIFSLGLLLSSLFVFNTMGVIDEGAIDRLYLVSELTKHVCLSADTSRVASSGQSLESTGSSDDDTDALAESRALAPHFPPFVWLLRDFMLDMQADGLALTPNAYLEKSLEPRDGNSRRHADRNKIRQSIRVLFDQRECLTLVRPVMDETQLRHAAQLSDDLLRPEFVQQMDHVRERLLSVVAPKALFGKVLDGAKLAHLVTCYTETLNSGSVPDIKAAWAYVSEATCQTAMLNAMELYDTRMAPANYTEDDEDQVRDEPLLSQQEFEKLHKDAQDEALNLFKNLSVEGPTRAASFQKLKSHVQKQKTLMVAALQKVSTALCEKVLKGLTTEWLSEPLARGQWDDRFFERREDGSGVFMELAATMDAIEQRYEDQAQGPAKKVAFFHFLRADVLHFHEQLLARLASRHETMVRDWERRLEQLQQAKDRAEAQLQQQLRERESEIERLHDAKQHADEKSRMQEARIQELQTQHEQQLTATASLQAKHEQLTALLEQVQSEKTAMEMELEKTRTSLEHARESLLQREDELRQAKIEWAKEIDSLRTQQQHDREEWIQKLADQTAEKASVQKVLKQRDHELQQHTLAMEMLRKESEQRQHELNVERQARAQKELDLEALQERHVALEKRLEESVASHLVQQDHAEREHQRLQQRLERYEAQLGSVANDRQVEDALQACVTEVVRLAEVEKANVLLEERNVLQERLGEMYLKVSVLPEFYQREIFCSPDPDPNFFDALTK